jgi:hypothetical protein
LWMEQEVTNGLRLWHVFFLVVSAFLSVGKHMAIFNILDTIAH